MHVVGDTQQNHNADPFMDRWTNERINNWLGRDGKLSYKLYGTEAKINKILSNYCERKLIFIFTLLRSLAGHWDAGYVSLA